ncbi:MAG: MATE family efflux transporter [Clostridiales bacterium]|nr:MATE family efflux transporter [Clostridiales bacterium]
MIQKGFYRNILRLSLPAAFQALMSLLVVMVDNLMVSRLDSQGFNLAAVSQSNSITNFVNAALMGMAAGSVVLISQYWGKRDTKRIKPICATVLSLCFGFAAFMALFLHLFPSLVLNLVISKNETSITELALDYLPILSLSYLPLAITASVIAILKGVEVVRVTLFATIVSLFTNIGFNYVLIFGKLGLPALGVRGAAIATVLARLIEAGVVCYYLLRVQKTIPLKARDFLSHRGWAWTDYIRFGLPVGLTDAQWALIGMLKMVIIGQLGRIMINAVAVSDMLLNLGTLFTFALAGGAAVVVGKAVGAKDYDYVRSISKRIQLMFLFIGIIMATLVFFIRNPFISLYGLEDNIASQASLMVAVTAFTLLGTTYHASCFVGINRGAGDSRFVMMVDMICGWLIVLPAAFLSAFVLKLPYQWVYFSTRIDQSFKWIIAFLRLRGDKWIHNVTRGDTP